MCIRDRATDEIKGEADTQSQESSSSDDGGKSSFWSGLVDKVENTVTGAKVKSILVGDKDAQTADAGRPVTIQLDKEVDVSLSLIHI